jgi:hypothetical protein
MEYVEKILIRKIFNSAGLPDYRYFEETYYLLHRRLLLHFTNELEGVERVSTLSYEDLLV